MKNLKKFAALGLSAAMVLSLAACGSGTKNTTTDTTAAKTEEAAKQKRQEILRLREIRQRPAETWTRARS